MKLFRRILSAAAAMTVFATTFAAVPMSESAAATVVTVSPYDVYDINGGKFEGWGTSLCWWANRLGYSDSLAQQAADGFVVALDASIGFLVVDVTSYNRNFRSRNFSIRNRLFDSPVKFMVSKPCNVIFCGVHKFCYIRTL